MRWLLVLLLSGCALSPTEVLDFARVDGPYVPPLTQDKYTYTVYGFYIERASFNINKSTILYTVLYDNRNVAKQYKDKYEVNAEFDRLFPVYVAHTGSTDCQTQAGQATVTKLNIDFKTIHQAPLKGKSDVNQALCLMLKLTQEKL